MTNDAFQKTYDDQLAMLPELNRKAIQSHDWMTELISIGKKHGLHVDQIDDLRVEVMLVLVGALPAGEFQNTIMAELAVSPAEAEKITVDVNTEILDPIHDFIVSGGTTSLSNTPQPPTPSVPPSPTVPIPSTNLNQVLEKTGMTITPTPAQQPQVSGMPQSALMKTGIVTMAEPLPKPDTMPTEAKLQETIAKTLNSQAPKAQAQPTAPAPNEQKTRATLESVLNRKPVPAPTTSSDDRRAEALKKLDAMLGGGL